MTEGHRFGEPDLKHLELLQNVIARLSNNSFLIKGWYMTLNGVLLAVANRSPDWRTIPAASVLTVGFWLLDSYYLRQERLFRILYEKVVTRAENPPPVFTMDAERYGGPVNRRSVMLTRPMLFCYGVLATADVMLILFMD